MREKINVKVVAIAILTIIVLAVGIFFVAKVINKNNKNYKLEKVSEKDYKYFGVVTEGKSGVIDAKRQYNS